MILHFNLFNFAGTSSTENPESTTDGNANNGTVSPTNAGKEEKVGINWK